MAHIILGLGTSHGPMLSIAPEIWPERVKGGSGESAPLLSGKDLHVRRTRQPAQGGKSRGAMHARSLPRASCACRQAIRNSRTSSTQARPTSQSSSATIRWRFLPAEHVPAFAVFWGEFVEGIPADSGIPGELPPGIAAAEADRTPTSLYTQYPTLPDSRTPHYRDAMHDGFDVAQLTKLHTGEIGSNAVPHAWGFVYRRIMRDKVVPHVPVFVNTFYPPNQPSALRCFNFGRSIARAISSWP